MTTQRLHNDNSETKTDRETARKEQQSTGTRTTTTTYNTDPGVSCLSAYDLESIQAAYMDVLGDLNPYKGRCIIDASKHGVTVSAILDAIEQTALAPRPSHAYLAAILRRYASDGIKTADDAERDRMRRRHAMDMANYERNLWWSNPQRETW